MGIRVVVADDSLLVREGVRALLSDQPDLSVIGLAADHDELLSTVEQLAPDVVVTDICMPPTNTDEGVRAAIALRAGHPSVGVVVLSQYDDPAHATALLQDGVAGRAYLLKERVAQPGQLAEAVRAVAGGGSVIDPRIVEAMLTARSRPASSALRHLTARERQVLSEMATGANNATIADRLFVTVRAVERHINSIFAKLGLAEEGETHRRVGAVLLYLADR
ncbi:response regulator transcription factor [Dactylosporangium darangshiense]|jgi:DNA-binding NarL/FixJ family response regulator|uniref:Response regulator transcription factor n=1 Tax=Dactylosporangium darangshiense TaxID=579108 RepID=A0ABP8DL05_9ACTN|nr:response regulator transcription factor [Dactylosporangium sp.]